MFRFRELAAHIRAEVLGVPQSDADDSEVDAGQAPVRDGAGDDAGDVDTFLEELFDEVDRCDVDTELEADGEGDNTEPEFAPATSEGFDILSPMLRDLLSDIPIAGAPSAPAPRMPARVAGSSKASLNVDDVDFTF